ncbi:MBL fold metallo-hydrolase [Lichenibacterium ramalinae]|uniref:MBL fold metallo-hydrolase n=1 Tax=Lichenibacterium ramalinae TaxID=2316527 RepID=A0A4Q2RFE5_9HYPH|nr:MBL fold metallo-hydrolase [Lichenibacterium ramalinae]RYB06041.1 MBL fold metallo-hydrolase [Lichenibacterium ramalinae]
MVDGQAISKSHGVPPEGWYEALPFADDVTLIHEPWMPPFYRGHMWLVRGRDRDLLIDAGLGHVPLRASLPILRGRPVTLLVSHVHWDHIGAAHEFDGPEDERLVHPALAAVLADPAPDATLFANYADGSRDADAFTRRPEGWSAGAHRIAPAPATGFVDEGDRIDLGGRSLTVLHTPGHCRGHLALFEERTGTLFAQDAVYDGPLVDTCPDSDIAAYRATLARLRAEIAPRIVHGGHFPSFGAVRFRQIVDAYLAATDPCGGAA